MVALVRIRARLLGERGDALISGLLTLGLVLLVAALAIQLVGFAHCRNVAQAAAQDGAETAAAQGAGAGVVRAEAIRRRWRRPARLHTGRDERHHGHGQRPRAPCLPRRRSDAAGGERTRERPRRALPHRRNTAMNTATLRDRLAGERGEASIVSGVLLLAGVLIPLMFLIALYARVELAQVDSQQAARDAVRSAVRAPNATAADAAAADAVAREQAAAGMPLSLSLTGTYARGQTMGAQVTVRVPIGSLPFLGHFGTIVVHSRASAPVDRYRSLLEGAAVP
jgi:hypothetical protein